MGLPRINRFKVETVWPQLIHRRIQKIEIALQEILIVNRSGLLLANGAFDRVITYLEKDGRLRNVGDQVQFQVTVGQALPEPLPFFYTELISDYYIFQTRSDDAILEQDFILTVRDREPANQAIVTERLLFDCIIGCHQGSDLLKVMVTFPEMPVCPRNFRGAIEFNETFSAALLSGRIRGVTEYMTSTHQVATLEMDHSFSVLPEDFGEPPDLRRRITGRLVDYWWTQVAAGIWELEVKYDYSLMSLQAQALNCLKPLADDGLGIRHRVKATVLMGVQDFRFSKTWQFPFVRGEPNEIKVDVITKEERLTQKGVFLEALFKVELYYAQIDGTEGYRQWEVFYSELIEGITYEANLKDLRVDGILHVDRIGFELVNQELAVTMVADYRVQIFLTQVMDLLEDESGGVPVMAKVLTDTRRFSILKETKLMLGKEPVGIHWIRADFIHTDVETKPGWLHLSGDLMLTVSYSEHCGRIIEENSRVPFEQSYLWEGLDNDRDLEIRAKIEFDTYRLEDRELWYQYLMGVDVQRYDQRELRLKVLPSESRGLGSYGPVVAENSLESFEELSWVVEQEIRLKLGIPGKISANRVDVETFACSNALNALFVEGSLGVELEYWDETGFLRQEPFRIDFWKFIAVPVQPRWPWVEDQFWPRIQSATFIPVNAWPWQKGMVRAVVKLKLIKVRSGEYQ